MKDRRYISVKPSLLSNENKADMSFRAYLAIRSLKADMDLHGPEGTVKGISYKALSSAFYKLGIRKPRRQRILGVLKKEDIIRVYDGGISFVNLVNYYVPMKIKEIEYCVDTFDELTIRALLYLWNKYNINQQHYGSNSPYCFSYSELAYNAFGRKIGKSGVKTPDCRANRVVKDKLEILEKGHHICYNTFFKTIGNVPVQYHQLLWAGKNLKQRKKEKLEQMNIEEIKKLMPQEEDEDYIDSFEFEPAEEYATQYVAYLEDFANNIKDDNDKKPLAAKDKDVAEEMIVEEKQKMPPKVEKTIIAQKEEVDGDKALIDWFEEDDITGAEKYLWGSLPFLFLKVVDVFKDFQYDTFNTKMPDDYYREFLRDVCPSPFVKVMRFWWQKCGNRDDLNNVDSYMSSFIDFWGKAAIGVGGNMFDNICRNIGDRENARLDFDDSWNSDLKRFNSKNPQLMPRHRPEEGEWFDGQWDELYSGKWDEYYPTQEKTRLLKVV